MKINVHLANKMNPDVTSLQLFDWYYAYTQFKNKHNDYKTNLSIKIGPDLPMDQDAINIGFYNLPKHPVEHEKFDLVILDANQHHLEFVNQEMYNAFINYNNCYLLSGVWVDPTYPRADKIITLSFFIMNRDFYVRPFYPQYFDRQMARNRPRQNLIFINGQPKPNRQFMAGLVESVCGPLVTVKKDAYRGQLNVNPCWFETPEDTEFREYFSDPAVVKYSNMLGKNFYTNSVMIGIDKKFGAVAPGYFLIDEYWDYSCVIFPDTTWLNDEVFVTEKISKCAVSRSIPWPIGGANMDVLYDQIGFKTAWHLLPDHLKSYTYEKDHVKRYRMCAEAIKWLAEHPEKLIDTQALEIIEHNYNFFFNNTLDATGPIKFDSIIQKYIK